MQERFFQPFALCCKCKQPACYELVTNTEVAMSYNRSAYTRQTRKPYCEKCAQKSGCCAYAREPADKE